MTARTRFFVTLEGAAGVDTMHLHALRLLLKRLLRSHSLRCIDVRQLDGHRYRDDDGGDR
jgi:hypothetical protein